MEEEEATHRTHRPRHTTGAGYRPFRKKRFVRASESSTGGGDDDADHAAGLDEDDEGVQRAERARLGEEASSFYAHLLSSSSSSSTSTSSSARPSTSSSSAYRPLRPLHRLSSPSSTTTAATTTSSSSSSSSSSRSAVTGQDTATIIKTKTPDDGECADDADADGADGAGEEEGEGGKGGGPGWYYCGTCGERVPGSMPPTEHRTSTVHVLCSPHHRPTPTYGIPPNNVGYQMLLHKFDWMQDRGLGPEGQGRLEPVPTRLRPAGDRRGVEATREQPLRITHTQARHGIREQDDDDADDGQAGHEARAPLLPNEALALGGAQMTEEERKRRKKRKKQQKNERRRKKRHQEELQQQRDQGLREAVYNEWPVLLAP